MVRRLERTRHDRHAAAAPPSSVGVAGRSVARGCLLKEGTTLPRPDYSEASAQGRHAAAHLGVCNSNRCCDRQCG
jgi:hypothetical protein